MKYCGHCGQQLLENHRFCASCGGAVVTAANDGAETALRPAFADDSPEGDPSANATPYADMCRILGEVWANHTDNPDFAAFLEYNDIGVPLAYFLSEGIVESTPLAKTYVDEAWILLLNALGLEDDGWDSLDDMLEQGEFIEVEY